MNLLWRFIKHITTSFVYKAEKPCLEADTAPKKTVFQEK